MSNPGIKTQLWPLNGLDDSGKALSYDSPSRVSDPQPSILTSGDWNDNALNPVMVVDIFVYRRADVATQRDCTEQCPGQCIVTTDANK